MFFKSMRYLVLVLFMLLNVNSDAQTEEKAKLTFGASFYYIPPGLAQPVVEGLYQGSSHYLNRQSMNFRLSLEVNRFSFYLGAGISQHKS